MLGYTIVESPLMVIKQLTKFPRKKKNRRWHKKYMKKYAVYVPRTDLLIFRPDRCIVCHPETAIILREDIKAFRRLPPFGCAP